MTEFQSANGSTVASAVQDIDAFEKQVAGPLAALKKLKDRLAKARQDMVKDKPVSKLKALIADLRTMGSLKNAIDPQDLLPVMERHLRNLAENYVVSLRDEIKQLCDTQRIPCKPLADELAVGPFKLAVDHAKEAASLFYAKVPAAKDLPLEPTEILKIAQELAVSLLQPPNIKMFGGQLDEAMRVAMARQRKPLIRGDWRVELPAVFREMCHIRQGNQEKSGSAYSLPRFVVELKTLVQSDENLNGERRFRLETAVLENTKDSRKSVFVPADVSAGYGEGTYYQAIVMIAPAA